MANNFPVDAPVIAAKSPENPCQPTERDRSECGNDLRKIVCGDILQALQGLQFGEVTITVRDGRVISIERVTRRRQIVSKQKE